ncbi:MAG: DUF1540 domain-containing protein [Clostridia bacterium]|nr:DUF1540 domain-containing protein [Clostridia bacterium]
MKDLKCGMKNCRYNKGYCCCAKEIDVNAETDCTTYSPDEEKSRSLFEAGSDFVKSDYSIDTNVLCGADCIFNRDGKCIANGITVMGQGNSDAACLTFIKN